MDDINNMVKKQGTSSFKDFLKNKNSSVSGATKVEAPKVENVKSELPKSNAINTPNNNSVENKVGAKAYQYTPEYWNEAARKLREQNKNKKSIQVAVEKAKENKEAQIPNEKFDYAGQKIRDAIKYHKDNGTVSTFHMEFANNPEVYDALEEAFGPEITKLSTMKEDPSAVDDPNVRLGHALSILYNANEEQIQKFLKFYSKKK